MSPQLDMVAEALADAGSRGSRSSWTCPSHEDRSPSLSLTDGIKGVVMKCHAGCEVTDILGAIGLTEADLFYEPLTRDEEEARYPYTDESGELLFTKIRKPGKKFLNRAADGSWTLTGVRRVLYNLPALVKAAESGETVYVTEGEKDAETLISLGLTATTNFDGAGSWREDYNQFFTGLDVVIVGDNDQAGQKHIILVEKNLSPVAKSVSTRVSPIGKDVTDLIRAGHALDELEPFLEPFPVHLTPAGEDDARQGRRIVLTAAADIEPEPVVWAWEEDGKGRIPAGSLGLAAGREGTGKSCCGIWLTARITTGTLPGKFWGKPRNVIIVAVEDSWKHTIVPRLIAAGADRNRVFRTEVQTEDCKDLTISLPADNVLLEEAILQYDVAMVLIDPLMSAVGEKIDTHKERDVRTALDPLAKMAARTDAIVLGIAHFNKGQSTDAASLITGSGAFKNVARFIFGFAADEDNMVMTQVKNSLGRNDLPSLAYRIESALVQTAKGDADVGRFVVEGESSRTVAEILAASAKPGNGKPGEEAEDFLRRVLSGGPAPSKAVEEEAGMLGISIRTLKRVKKNMKIASRQSATGWFMALPEHAGDL